MLALRHMGAATGGAALAILLCVSSTPAAEPRQLTLENALSEASTNSPVLRVHQADVERALARLTTAQTYPFNPEVAVWAADRDGAEGSTTDRGVELSQEIELGGKSRRRVELAQAELDAARAQLRRDERLLSARVQVAFVEALRARERLAVEQASIELARKLADVAQRRLDSGSATQIEVNLALAQMGRDERTLYLAEGAYAQSLAFLAEMLGMDPADPPEPAGALELASTSLPPLTDIVDSALAQREDLNQLRHALDAAQARREVAKRQTVPNVHLGAFYEMEEGTDRILGATLGISIPIFNRNRGAIAEAEAIQRQVTAEGEAVRIRARQEVVSAWSRYQAATSAAQGFQQVIGNLDENLDLLRRSLEAGKIGWSEILLFRREFADAQRAYVDTLADARFAEIELKLASGRQLALSQEEE